MQTPLPAPRETTLSALEAPWRLQTLCAFSAEGWQLAEGNSAERREERMYLDEEAVAAGADSLQRAYTAKFRLRSDAEQAARVVLVAALAVQQRGRRRRAHVWTREEDLRLLAWRREGKTYATLAKLTGLTESQLACRKYTLCSEPGDEAYLKALEQELQQAGGRNDR